jgi:hypothetical protein
MRAFFPFLLCAISTLAADRIATPYEAARGATGDRSAAAFAEWLKQNDTAVRARLAQGELDSMVNLLLFGTSFTQQPRMTIENFAAETRAGLLRTRLDDFLKTVANPAGNERIEMLRSTLGGKGGAFILENVQRVLQERIEINGRIAQQESAANAFSTRGVSLDTTILPNYAIDAALHEIKARGLLRSVARAAIVGPGLDFIDKEAGFDYYPLQTLQPFAVHDSLRRLGLGADARLTVLDISPRVLAHIAGLRGRRSYTIQLPRDTARHWTPAALEYWRAFGPENVQPIPAPLKDVETRAARFPIPRIDAADVNIVGQQLVLKPAEKFHLVVATNILVYYSPMEQALAAANIAAMLAPGGVLLTNDLLPQAPGSPLKLAGQTEVLYSEQPKTVDTIYWYQR